MKLLIKLVAIVALMAAIVAPSQAQGLKTVTTLNAIKLVQPDANSPYVLVTGFAAASDGGGGLYKINTASSLATNYAVVTSTLNTSAQWIRMGGFGSFTAPPRVQTLGAATNILAEASAIKVVGTGGATTLTATPIISTTLTGGLVDGQELRIIGTDDTNTVVLTDNGTSAGTKLELGASTRTLGLGDILTLKYDLALTSWREVSFVNN